MEYPGAYETLDKLFRLVPSVRYLQSEKSWADAGVQWATTLHDLGLRVRVETAPATSPDGLRIEIYNRTAFYEHRRIRLLVQKQEDDRPFSEVGGQDDPVLCAFYSREDCREAIIRAMGETHGYEVSMSHLAAFVKAFQSWAPANDDYPRMVARRLRHLASTITRRWG